MVTPAHAPDERAILTTIIAAEAERREIPKFSAERPEFDLDAAYRVQRAGIEHRAASGRPRVGVKLGLTSYAKQEQMGVDAPITGVLTEDMRLSPGEELRLDELIHPKVEPEIAFVFAAPLAGEDVTAAEVRAAVLSVHGAVEIIDSRYLNFDFELTDVVADNASSARYLVLPDGVAPDSVDVIAEAVTMRVGQGTPVEATGAAVMGDPYEAVAVAVRALAGRGDGIRAGELVLTGALTAAQLIEPGSTTVAEFSTLGTIQLSASATR